MTRTSPKFLTALCAALFLFMYGPLFVLMLYSFNVTEYGVSWQGFTLQWYKEILTNDNVQNALKVSLLVAIPCVLISTAIGTLTAFAIYRNRFLGRGLLQGILYIPLLMPDLVMGVTLLLLFTSIGLSLGIMSILLAHISFSIPLATLVIIGRMARIDRRLEEAAMDLGADELTTMWKVTLPLLMPGILAAALLVFPWSFNDFVITYFVSGVGSSTLPLRVYSMIRVGVSPAVNALGTLIVVIPLVIVIIGILLEKRRV